MATHCLSFAKFTYQQLHLPSIVLATFTCCTSRTRTGVREYKQHRRGDVVNGLCDNLHRSLPCEMQKFDGPQLRQLYRFDINAARRYNYNALTGEKARRNFTKRPMTQGPGSPLPCSTDRVVRMMKIASSTIVYPPLTRSHRTLLSQHVRGTLPYACPWFSHEKSGVNTHCSQ